MIKATPHAGLQVLAQEAWDLASDLTRTTSEVLERHTRVFLCFASLLYFAGICGAAYQRPFWHDEIFTLYLSRLSLRQLWEALGSGVDLNPPLHYLVARAANGLGESPLISRLPSILGFWGMCLCLFRFTARRCGAVVGAIALLAPVFTGAYPYAIEDRPYGFMLLCVGLGLICWQELAADGRRLLAAAGLALSLAAAVSSHYFAVLIVACLGLGELVRWAIRRKADWLACLSLGFALLPLVWFRPMVQNASTYWPAFWTKSGVWATSIADTYRWLLEPALFAILMAIILLVVLIAAGGESRGGARWAEPWPVPVHEMVAAGAFLGLPLMGTWVTGMRGAPYYHRYVIATVIGVALAFAYAVAFGSRRHRSFGTALILLLVLWFGNVQARQALLLRGQPGDPFQGSLIPAAKNANLPIVYHDSSDFLQAAYYAAPAVASRLYYLVDMQSALQYQKYDTSDRALIELRKWAPIQVPDFDDFVKKHRTFYVLWKRNTPFGWLIYKLWNDGCRLEFVSGNGVELLFLATVN